MKCLLEFFIPKLKHLYDTLSPPFPTGIQFQTMIILWCLYSRFIHLNSRYNGDNYEN